ncbi:hypothetical protein NQ317_012762 [Molorchus minor]|uniref:RRM domain-containing protein n=1 Tax=Molorchus minor TaxID=1323400 RepID=A0ABQ9K524_9CUCU|nr:hypothetical protein NQ317_012762 [Molorchus minor]
MSVIIRLQNLPWSANALDIRQYFHGLSIPEGGVHIVGGEQGDAFIAFSTDEDARQAFTRNNGKIKEIQITLMLSSRTEMQRVIESARAQSYAAFMGTTPAVPAASATVPLPAAVPAIIPAAVPEMKKETKESRGDKKDSRRRSRSKSRDRKDRSRDRDRKDKRHRDRSRSRSRDRKERRRRDRSRSRGRSRSRDRDRRSRTSKRSEERTITPFQRDPRKPMPEIWANQAQLKLDTLPQVPQPPSILGTFPVTLDQAKRTLNSLTTGMQSMQSNGFQPPNNNNFNSLAGSRGRDSWPPVAAQNFQSKQQNFLGKRASQGEDRENFPNRFQRNFQKNRNQDEEGFNGFCVSIEPFYGGYAEVRRFFQGLFISNSGIKFMKEANGRRNGVVYVQFGNRRAKEEALSYSGRVLNNVNVDVRHINDAEFEEPVEKFVPSHTDDSSNESAPRRFRNVSKFFNNRTMSPVPDIKDFACLVIDDLPTYSKEQDILHMFSQHPLVALILTTKPRGGHIAYVKFSSKEVAKKAFEEKSHHVIGGKAVTVKPCKDEEFEEINKQHEVDLTGSKDDNNVGTDCLSVFRLPPKTNDKDIADFFSDIGVIPTKIHLMSNSMGFTGQAYCEFMTSEEATRASKKDDTILGNNHISVKPISREEMTTILGHTVPAPSVAATEEEPAVTQPLQLPPQKKPNPIQKAMNSPVEGANPNISYSDFMGPGVPPMNRPFFRNFENGPPRGRHGFGPRNMGPRGPRFPPMQEQFEDHPPAGCTVYMKNVPYKAGTNEILDYFDGYNITNHVSRRYNPNNTPSDEAKVVFYDPEDAYRAVQELNQQKIWDRTIYLKQE